MPTDHPEGPLVLGPLMRHVGEHTASIWVETAGSATVVVRTPADSWCRRTFAAHGRHYALVEVDGLEAGTVQPYAVEVDGVPAWPPSDSRFPPSCIATLDPDKPARVAFGSCRTSIPHDKAGNRRHGVDAMRAYAVQMSAGGRSWPDLLLFLGDQVYADETSDAMREFIAARRDPSQPPGNELKDFVEYAHLYWLAWTDPANRWLLSTVPSAMIFDDHDVRDDWNTSLSWHEQMNAKPWWHERIVGALGSYWVYQHLGNLSPEALAKDELWQRIVAHEESEQQQELDITEQLDDFAARVDREPRGYRWSYSRELGRSRLVVVDSRAARVLDPYQRSMLNSAELGWLELQLQGGFDHLFVGTSLPFLLPPGLHDLEAINEAMAAGRWGERVARFGERLRQAVDLEHWAAFERGFGDVFELVMSVARGERGVAPGTITFLSGDVHNSFVTEVLRPQQYGAQSRILQAVCSPIRNPLPRHVRVLTSLVGRGLAWPLRQFVARSPKVPDPAYRWAVTQGPWFDNNVATIEVAGRGLRIRWEAGVVVDGCDEQPQLRTVAEVEVGVEEHAPANRGGPRERRDTQLLQDRESGAGVAPRRRPGC